MNIRSFAAVALFVAAFLAFMAGFARADDRFPPRDMAVHVHKAKHPHHKVRKTSFHKRHAHRRYYRRVITRRDSGAAVGGWHVARRHPPHQPVIIPRPWRAAAPARFIAGRLVCAINVNAALAARGIRGTGSALAKSFLRWGRPSGPVPGAVAVYNRRGGGHVAIVAKVVRGRVIVWNPGRHGWRLVAYPRQAIAYRVAG